MTPDTATDPTPAERARRDPEAFVAAAERATNERDLAAVEPLYSPDAELEVVTNGSVLSASGTEVVEAWRTLFGFMERRRMRVAKQLVSSSDGVLVNRWTAAPGSGGGSSGVECWHFGSDGLVVEHQLDIHLDPRPERDLIQRLRLLIAHPRSAIAFLRASRR
jgi:hypothetical protein